MSAYDLYMKKLVHVTDYDRDSGHVREHFRGLGDAKPIAFNERPLDSLDHLSEDERQNFLTHIDGQPNNHADAAVSYSGIAYIEWNGYLREVVRDDGTTFDYVAKDGLALKSMEDLQEAIFSSPAPTDLVVYRRMQLEDKVGESVKEGVTFRDNGFVSTTHNGYSIIGYESKDPPYGKGDLYFVAIHVPKGFPALSIEKVSKYRDEREIVLPAGTEFKVLSVETSQQQPRRKFVNLAIVGQRSRLNAAKKGGEQPLEAKLDPLPMKKRPERFTWEASHIIWLPSPGKSAHDAYR